MLSAAVVSTDAIAAIAIATHVHTCLHAEIYDEMVTILTNFAGLFCVFLSGVSVGVLRAIFCMCCACFTSGLMSNGWAGVYGAVL